MKRSIPLVVALVLIATAGVAVATPDSGSTIYACASQGAGWLRLVEGDAWPGACTDAEYPVSWSQAGSSCSVTQTGDNQFTMTCPDGTSVSWSGAPPAALSAQGLDGAGTGETLDVEAAAPQACLAASLSAQPSLDMSGQPETDREAGNFRGCNFRGAVWEDIPIIGVILADVILTDASLKNSLFEDVDLSGARVSGSDLSNSTLVSVDARGADFTRALMEDVDMQVVDFTGGVFDYADLSNSDIDAGVFADTSFYRAEITDTYLWGIDLSGADLTEADLSDASLMWADLRGANLTGAILTGADLLSADLTDAIGLEEAIWGDVICPDGFYSIEWDSCEGHLTPYTNIMPHSLSAELYH